MELLTTAAYQRWRRHVVATDASGRTELLLLAMESELLALGRPPVVDRPSLKRVRQARRHEIWRTSHPYREDRALRIIVWFPDERRAVLALLGFDKARLGDVWYDRAAAEGQAMVDQILRDWERP